MARMDFFNQIQSLGFDPQIIQNIFVSFKYIIPVGKFTDKEVMLALQVGDDFPMIPPPGPHFNPHLLPITGGGGSHPNGAIHTSPLGLDWQYWSRPFSDWPKTSRTAKDYMSHIRHLLDTL
jgi:hypothetical protein